MYPVECSRLILSKHAVDVPIWLGAGAVDTVPIDPETAALAVLNAVVIANIILYGPAGCGVSSVSYTHLTLPTTPYV